MIFAGIDGGATSTRVLLLTEEGEVFGSGEGDSSNYDNVGIERAKASIDEAVRRAWEAAGKRPGRLDGVFFGVAGVVSEADRAVICKIALDLGLAEMERIGVDHDIRIALAGGFAGGEGLALIVGTGSSCYGRRADGRHHRTGWGYLLDDLGSGYYLGLQGMIACVRAVDGRGRETVLSSLFQDALGYRHIDEIMRILYHGRMGVAEVAALAPLVVGAAERGDAVARRIVQAGTFELARMVQAVAAALEFVPGTVPLIIVGGVVGGSPYYRRILEGQIMQMVPSCSIRDPILLPVAGAGLLALELAGVRISDRIVDNLRSWKPGTTLE